MTKMFSKFKKKNTHTGTNWKDVMHTMQQESREQEQTTEAVERMKTIFVFVFCSIFCTKHLNYKLVVIQNSDVLLL